MSKPLAAINIIWAIWSESNKHYKFRGVESEFMMYDELIKRMQYEGKRSIKYACLWRGVLS